jgi:hypothetical protein
MADAALLMEEDGNSLRFFAGSAVLETFFLFLFNVKCENTVCPVYVKWRNRHTKQCKQTIETHSMSYFSMIDDLLRFFVVFRGNPE